MSVIDIFDNIDDEQNAFNIMYKQILDQHAPIKTIKVDTRPVSFMNDNIRALMKTRDKWQKLAKQTNDSAAWSAYRNYKHEVRQELRIAQKAYVEDQIKQNPNDANTTWKMIRSCIPKRSASIKKKRL